MGGIDMNHPFSMQKDSVIDDLKTDITSGLSNAEADKRLAQYGPNSLGEEKKVPLWKRFLQQFADAMVLILIGAAILSAIMAVREGGFEGWIDVIVILSIVIINAMLGVYQEGKADEAHILLLHILAYFLFGKVHRDRLLSDSFNMLKDNIRGIPLSMQIGEKNGSNLTKARNRSILATVLRQRRLGGLSAPVRRCLFLFAFAFIF